ncbi:MAG: NFACT family protein [Clostridia bacterium]|nr:NFACT family protein [Clostridia bacterium]
MALDGVFLKCLKNEIKNEAVSCRVEKIHQPSREEVVIVLRGRNGQKKLLLSARANSPRINFTQRSPENPKVPPMLCMLLRKHLQNAVLSDVRQHETDRILFLDFDATNEIGDAVKLTLCIEIMAQHSNVILIDENGTIIDALKRVDFSKSSVRQVLPGMQYRIAVTQNKFDIQTTDADFLAQKIFEKEDKNLSGAIMSVVQGLSPVSARQIAFNCENDDRKCFEYDEKAKEKVARTIRKIQDDMRENNLGAFVYYDDENRPKDFCFLPLTQYEGLGRCEKAEGFSALLEDFYYEKDRLERMKQRSSDLYKFLQNTLARIAKKINLQRSDLEKCADKEKLKIYAELINAYQFELKKGSSFYEVADYYDNNKTVRIPVDPALSPSENSQRYYKEYKKSKTAETMLQKLIEENERELEYIETVIDELTRSETQAEIDDISAELSQNGYGKKRNADKFKKQKKAPELSEYVTSDGFTVLVGKNNVQNDYLTFKRAAKNDMWLHTKEIPGSHVVIVSDNREISDKAIEEASVIAAYHSKARQSYQVQVDYTFVRELKKPVGAKPGKVIYHKYYTITANPDLNLVNKLKK